MRSTLILLVIAVIFVIHCLSLNFTQDDAFISYRYVKNFLEGNGLVFNSGERVEGYTNFLWIILLSIFAGLGLDIILVSKILGIASGCLTLFLLHRISRLFFSKRDWWLALFPPFLLTASSAFAYWSTSGLETTFFTVMVLLSVYLYLSHRRFWVMSSAVSALIRPEGVLIFGILFLHRLLFAKARPGEYLSSLGWFALLLLPFAIFKLWYYGDILPNPFYAKTGFSFEYVKSGFEYLWLFLRHYGLWGLVYLLPIFLYRRLHRDGQLLMSLVYLYTLYVVIIGGDVLPAHRFLLPVLPLSHLLFVVCLYKVRVKLKGNTIRKMFIPMVSILVSILLFLVPYRWIRETRANESGLVEKMEVIARYLNEHYGAGFCLATTTIGSISYYLGTDVRVLDMLGLTDRNISRYPEKMQGIAATWKERKYNSRYVLSLDPDFILFSTSYKPSAPAERALLLNSKFRQNYCVIPVMKDKTTFFPVFKTRGIYSKENEIFGEARFVDLFYEGTHLFGRRRYQAAIQKLKESASTGPEDFALVEELIGQSYFALGDYSAAEKHLDRAIQVDDCSVMAHVYLAAVYQNSGRLEEAETEKRKFHLYDPNFEWQEP